MTLDDLNIQLAKLASERNKETLLETARMITHYLGLKLPKNDTSERGFLPIKQDLKKYLVQNPLTRQGLLFSFAEEKQNIIIRLGVLKKLRKDQLTQLIDKENLRCFQDNPPFIQSRPSADPYLLYYVGTPEFDRIHIVLFQDNQKRIITLRNKLTATQYQKIFPQWQNVALKEKGEIAAQLWKSLDLKEVNKEFYKQIKEQFDNLVAISRNQYSKANENDVKQFAVRLIGRYIFCWFLKEKGIIADALLQSATISQTKNYCNEILRPLFFNTLNTPVAERKILKDASLLQQRMSIIPYLNGGLFDNHPEDFLFDHVDINEWLKEFVRVLENFDFTVDESSSQYQLVSIDPEMLGRIFENLLASQNEETAKLANQRKAFGAFYTPREIVDYMVNESLKAHIETHLLPSLPNDQNESSVAEPFVTYGGTLFEQLQPRQTQLPFGVRNQIQVNETERIRKNQQVKIDKLFEPGCQENPFNKEDTNRVRKALSGVTVLDPACGSGAFPMGMMLRLMELRQIVGHGHRNNYDLKSEILSKNIFGVDIMPMAVEIARLRAWLSLVLEADYKPNDKKNNFGIAALPNLDFKFICANSLIDSGYDAFLENVTRNATLYRLDGEIRKLQRLRDEYYDPKGDKARKENLQKEFNTTKNYIKTEFKSLKKAWNLENFLSHVDDWDPFDDSKPSSFFSPAWMFGIQDGLDIVIGNPPYVDIKRLPSVVVKEFFKIYKTTQKRINLYAVFLERGYNLLSSKGVISFIIPNSILVNESYSLLRGLLVKDVDLIIKLPDNVFEAIVETIIIQVIKGNNKELVRTVYFDRDVDVNFKELNFKLAGRGEWRSSDGRFNIFTDTQQAKVLRKIESSGKFLYEIADFSLGITPYDKYKGHSASDIKNRVFHSEKRLNKLFVPLISGTNIHKYFIDSEPIEEYLKYGDWLGAPREIRFFRAPRIIVRQIVSGKPDFRIYAGFTEKELYFTQIGFGIISKNNNIKETKVILAILNSNLIRFYHANKFLDKEKEIFQKILIANAKQFPIPNISVEYKNLLVKKVDEILLTGKTEFNLSILEGEVDVLVYKLYGLSYEEVKIIEPEFGMGEEEYENFTK